MTLPLDVRERILLIAAQLDAHMVWRKGHDQPKLRDGNSDFAMIARTMTPVWAVGG